MVKLADLAPELLNTLLDGVCAELLQPKFDPDDYAPEEEVGSEEEVLGKAPEGVKKLFAYSCQIFGWTIDPPADTPEDAIPVFQLKLEAAKFLLVEEIMNRFGEQLNGRQFELRRGWTVVATNNLRDGHSEIFHDACKGLNVPGLAVTRQPTI